MGSFQQVVKNSRGFELCTVRVNFQVQVGDLGSELCESGQEQGYKALEPMGWASVGPSVREP